MPLNPLAFDNQEEFEKALLENGLKNGWEPLGVPVDKIVHSILEHHGVLGMKWGRRKERVHPDIAHIPKATRKEAAKDAEEFTRAKLFYGQGAGIRRRLIKAKVEAKREKDKLYGEAFDHFVKQTDLAKRSSQARTERKRKDVTTHTKKTAKGVGNVLGGNNQNANTSARVAVGVGKLLFNQLQQSDDPVGDILEHHGVLGMKWGHRKVGAQKVVVSDRKKKIKTSGGEGHPAHPDAIRARTSKQILKKSGIKALSNKELQDFNQRLNLEQQAHRLTFQDQSKGKQFVDKLVGKGAGKGVEAGVKTGIGQVTKKRIAIGAAALAL